MTGDTGSTGDTATRHPDRNQATLAIVFALLGAALQAWGFVFGVRAALDAGGGGADAYAAVFFAGSALVLVAIVLSVVGLVRRRARGLWIVALIISLLPVAAVVAVWVAARV